MIAQVTGKLLQRGKDSVIVDVNGLGLRVFIAGDKILAELGQTITLHTHLHWREDGPSLFGFLAPEQLNLFNMLLNVNGVGPKTAQGIAESASPADLYNAVITQDLGILTRIKGVGKKTAERIVLELKGQIKGLPETVDMSPVGPSASAGGAPLVQAVAALTQLGYSPDEAQVLVKAAIQSGAGPAVEQIILSALQHADAV
jgi:Holliday junction DNA helicase RuvA